MPLLDKHFTVIVADTRGFGRTTRGDQPPSYGLFASDYIALLDQLHFSRVALVGTSDGGIIGLDIAIHHPERLSALFVQGANVTNDGIDRQPKDLSAIRLALARFHSEYLRLSPDPNGFADLRSDMDALDEREPAYSSSDLASIRIPTAVAVADHEESVRPEHSTYLASIIPGARLITIRNASHFAPLQNPKGFASAVETFLRALHRTE